MHQDAQAAVCLLSSAQYHLGSAPLSISDRPGLSFLPELERSLGAAMYTIAWQSGQELTLEEAVAYSLEVLQS